MPVLPFHRYIGPGNKSDNGEPVDEDDRIAKQHDIKYDNAKTEQDVRKADIEAIVLFRKNWLDGNWHSLIGDIGLSLKYAVESVTGVIYPDVQEIELNQKCEIIIISNILRLHCVYKPKPLIEKYKSNPFIDKKELKSPMVLKHLNTKNDLQAVLLSNFFYIPLNWKEIYYQIQLKNISDKDYFCYETFPHHTNKLTTYKYNTCKRDCTRQIIFQYINKLIANNNRSNKNSVKNKNRVHNNNIMMLIHSGYVFIDQDWNVYIEK